MTIVVFLVLFLLLATYRFIYYNKRLSYVKWFLQNYEKRIKGDEKGWLIVEETPRIKSYFKEAGMRSPIITEMELAGYGYVRPIHAEVLDNLSYKRKDFVITGINMIHQLIGYFKHKRSECLSITYWIEFLVNLPKHIAKYLGIKPERPFIKIIQLIYQLSCLLVLFYELNQAIPWYINLLKNKK